MQNSEIPLFASDVQAGFPSVADEYLEDSLNVHKLVVQHPAATFFVRVTGDSMINAHISPGDILVVDRSIEPSDGKVVIAVLNGEFTVKRLKKLNQECWLMPENPLYRPIKIREGSDFQIWGVVTYVIHKT